MMIDESIACEGNQALLHCGDKAVLYNTEMTLGKRIKAARKKCGITQEELAKEFKITSSAISGWERDEAFPEFDHLARLPKLLKVPANWLLTGGNSAPPQNDLLLLLEGLSPMQQRQAMRYLRVLADDDSDEAA